MTYLHALSGSSRPGGPRHRIVPGVPRPLALEARFMFDGAAAVEAAAAALVVAPDACEADGLQPLVQPDIHQAYAVDTDETPGTRDQNAHTFLGQALTVKSIEVDTTPGSGFSNDVLASLTLEIDGKETTYFGWISRQIKDGSKTQGLYFWTDPSFTSAGAARDGYKDQSKDPDKNNHAFILALGRTWEGAADQTFTEKSSSDIKPKDWKTDACEEPENRAPVATDDAPTTPEDTPITFGVTSNDSDADGDSMTVTGFSVINDSAIYREGQTATIAGKGTLTLTRNPDDTFTFTFTPILDFNGPVSGITYTVSDGRGGSDTASVTVNVTSLSDAPITSDLTVTVLEDGTYPFRAEDFGFSDPSDNPAHTLANVIITSLPAQGTLTYNNQAVVLTDNSFTVAASDIGLLKFSPAANASGSAYATIGFKVQDSGGASNGDVNTSEPKTITLAVTPVNDAPTANNDSVSGDEDTVISGNVLTNDTDPESPVDTLTVTGFSIIDPDTGQSLPGQLGTPVAIASAGLFTLNSDGRYTFTPGADYHGTVPVIIYTVTDAGNLSASTRLSLTVNPVNDAPTSTNDFATTNSGARLILSASDFGNFTDVDGDNLQAIRITTLPLDGKIERWNGLQWLALAGDESVSISDLQNGHLSFSPVKNTTALQFKVSDGSAWSTHTYTLHLQVTGLGPFVPPGGSEPRSPPPGSGAVPSVSRASVRDVFLPPANAQPIVLADFLNVHTPQNFDSTLYPHRANASMAASHLIETATGLLDLTDSHTEAFDNGWRARVHPDIHGQLTVWRGVSDQWVGTEGVSYVSIPWDSFSHTHSDARVTLEATLADGSPLPPWMHLDSRTGVFELVPPPQPAVELAIRVTARDVQGREAFTVFRIQVGEGARALNDGAAPAGRMSLSDQLREATRQSPTSLLALPPQSTTAPPPHVAAHPS